MLTVREILNLLAGLPHDMKVSYDSHDGCLDYIGGNQAVLVRNQDGEVHMHICDDEGDCISLSIDSDDFELVTNMEGTK